MGERKFRGKCSDSEGPGAQDQGNLLSRNGRSGDEGRIRGKTNECLRVGIIGAGLMGRWHAHAIKRAGGFIVGIMDIDMVTANQLAKKHPDAKIYVDLDEMIENCQPDILHICTPPATHFSLARLAIDAGVHLMIEKPVTPVVTDTERLFDYAASRHVIICPVHQFMFQEGVLEAKESLPRIGHLVHIEAIFCSAGGVGRPSLQLNEIVADILPHPLSIMQMLLPSGISENGWITMRPRVGELRASNVISGVTCSIFISMNARPTSCSLKIVGGDGTIHVDIFHGFSFMEPGKVSRPRKIIHPFEVACRRFSAAALNLARRSIQWEPAYPGLRTLVSSFYKAVQTGTEPPISREDTIELARVRNSLIQSAGLIYEQEVDTRPCTT